MAQSRTQLIPVKGRNMKTLFAVVIAVLTFSSLASAQAWNHDPASPIGPLHWGTVAPSDATCGDSITGELPMLVSSEQLSRLSGAEWCVGRTTSAVVEHRSPSMAAPA